MKRFFLIIVVTLAILAGQVQGQDVPTLSNLEIAIWPEYDRPEVLVIYRGLFADDTSLPVPVEIYIPARVGQPSAVAFVDGQERFNQPYETRVEGEWLVVSFELSTLGFQLEYYDPLPVDSNGLRTYTFSYTADYPITALSLEFQEPPTAEGFSLDPPADSAIQESDGLTYHLVQAGSVGRTETKSWTLRYQKDNSDLTASTLEQATIPEPAATPAAEPTGNSTVLIFLVAFVALIAVGAAAFWLGRRTQPVAQAAPPRYGPAKRRGSGRGGQVQGQRSPSSIGLAGLYCHQCGAELRPDADYCHRCGSIVRRE